MEPDCDIAKVVQAQVDAYNRHDVAAFVAFYDPDAELWNHPDGKMTMKGRVQMTDEYGRLFVQLPKLKVDIARRSVTPNYVIDEEVVRPDGVTAEFSAVAVYRVESCKITRVDFYE